MKLDVIKNEIQKVADAISMVIKIDVTIVNEDMERIAGTGKYADQVGERISRSSAFGVSIRDKKTMVIDCPRKSPLCKECFMVESCEEEAELCCPIVLNDHCYGVIGLIAFNEEQKNRITDERDNLVAFIEKMASLISGNLNAEIKSYEYNIEKNRIIKVFDGMDKAIVSTDENGLIISYNNKFTKIFGISYDPTGADITELIDYGEKGILEKFKKSRKNSDTIYAEGKKLKGICNMNKIFYEGQLKGFVIDFVDKKDAIQNFNKMNVDYTMTIEDIIGDSPNIVRVKKSALMASESTSTILITGDSGTGKELFARAIHTHSKRSDKPFVTLNCAAIPSELLESELFGYEDGAFTGARKGGKIGMFELANTGTIFLDEIGDMSLHLQSKLLRVLQEKEVRKVGGKKNIKIDVRIIAATNKNLLKMVDENLFREDLYYRLNVIPIMLPSLKDRKSDIPKLLEHMIKLYSDKLEKKVDSVDPDVLNMFINYEWPGNIRELQNVVEFCINMADSNIIHNSEQLMARFNVGKEIIKMNDPIIKMDKPLISMGSPMLSEMKPKVESRVQESRNREKNLGKYEEPFEIRTIEELERREIKKAIERYRVYKHDKEIIAEKLGISKATLYRKLKKYDLE